MYVPAPETAETVRLPPVEETEELSINASVRLATLLSEAATEKLRESMRQKRGEVKDFDLGPALEEIIAACEAETGLKPPVPQEQLRWAKMETPEEAMQRVRSQDSD